MDDDLSNANTDDSLLGSNASSEEIACKKAERRATVCCPESDLRGRCCGPTCKTFIGLFMIAWGLFTIVYTPFQLMMDERLRMMPGLPAFDWWQNPPDEVLLRVYLFNVTNAASFLDGTDAKLHVQEVGPIVYLEKLYHSNVTFNENGTMTYVATRKAIYLPEKNSIDMNQTLIVPNLAVLGMASYFWDAPFFEKWALNAMFGDAKMLVETTIHNYLWNFTDPVLETAQTIAPQMVPFKNMGMLSRIYEFFEDVVTVYIGKGYGHEKYFLIDRYDGSEYLSGHGSSCRDKVINSTEGVAYPQFLTKNTSLAYWRKTMCQVTTLYYDSEFDSKYGVKAYKYRLPASTFDRTEPKDKDCYRGDPLLKNGISDVSKCYFNFPLAASFPHFLYGDQELQDLVAGLRPNESEHGSFVDVEPITGVPLESRARSQSNLVIKNLDGFTEDVERFSNIIYPMFWAEYNQVGLPFHIAALMYFTVKVLPNAQIFFTIFLLIVGMLLVWFGTKTKIMTLGSLSYLSKNKKYRYEFDQILQKS